MLAATCSFLAFASQDPTAPLGWAKPAVVKSKPKVVRKRVPNLQSIVCDESEQNCRAILNGKVVTAGESVSGYRVNRIEPEVVTLSRSGKQWKLELFSLEVKQ
jgi:MSHA biogenesis protein MshK